MRKLLFWLIKGIQDFFSVDKQQAQGFLVLQLLIVSFLLLPVFYKKFIFSQTSLIQFDVGEVQALYEELFSKRADEVSINWDIGEEPIWKAINPNQATEADFVAIGFPSWLATRAVRYKMAGGEYRVKADLLKLYGMSEELFQQISPLIDLPEVQQKQSPKEAQNSVIARKEPHEAVAEISQEKNEVGMSLVRPLINLNTADSAQLISLRGIGPVLSDRIMKYRELLGGFVSVEQLTEVYGLRPETFEQIKPYVVVDEGAGIKRLKINCQTADELQNHPYLSSRHARAIATYRAQHGAFQDFNSLIKIYSIPDSVLLKLKPYIDFSTDENTEH
jgi:competence ComEA-like helix-hairpin-helix protein